MKVFTIGFTKKNAEQFFARLKQAGLTRVIDTRLNNVSQLAGFTKKDDLRFFLKEVAGIDVIFLAAVLADGGRIHTSGRAWHVQQEKCR